MSTAWRRLAPWRLPLTTLGVGLPLIFAVVVMAQRRWIPVLDLAMTEFRVQDVGTRRTPLIGLPGRIGDLPEQGSHPGPLSFWSLAPGYRLFGGAAWALEAATVSVALVWTGLAMWIGERRLGRAGIGLVALIVAVLVRGFGLSVLTQPWNPYMPLLAWLVVLLAAWAVFDGDHLMLLPLVAAASFAAQTHIPYLLMAGALGFFAAVVVVVRWARAQSTESGGGPPRIVLLTTAAFVTLWSAPLVDQLRRDPGNVTRLFDHFSAPSEDPIGLVAGFRLMLRHLDVVGGHLQLISGSERFLEQGFDPDGQIWAGAVMLLVWLASVFVAVRVSHHSLVSLHTVLGITLVLTVVSTSRIFGQRWFYLTLWAWVTTTLMIVAIAWTALVWARQRGPESSAAALFTTQRLTLACSGLAALITVASLVIAPTTQHPEEYLGETVNELLEPTIAALDPSQTYLVDWDDAYFFGSQAFGLVSELRRAGFDAGLSEFWQVPATSSRTVPPGEADQAIVLVTGEFIAGWRADERFTELAAVDPRTPDELAEYAALRDDLIADLEASGLDDLVSVVDTNLFGLNIDLRISPAARSTSARMIRLGQETAVFIGLPGLR